MPTNVFASVMVIAQYNETFFCMLSLTLLIKPIASSAVLLIGLSRYLFISGSERNAKISCVSSDDNCLSVSLSVVKIGSAMQFMLVFGLRISVISDYLTADSYSTVPV